jgi:hypothetical protein
MDASPRSRKVKLGDVVSKAARYLHRDLRHTINELARQPPDYRTVAMREHLNRSKVVLLQLLTICRWAGSKETIMFCSQLESLQKNIQEVNVRLNSDLDRMYFIHAGCYPMRSHAYNISLAKDIFIRQTYSHLPISLFLNENKTQHCLDTTTVENDMNIFLQAKILVVDSIDSNSIDIDVTIEKGVMKLIQRNLYTLTLTLSALDENAPWYIVNYQITVADDGNDFLSAHSTYNMNSIQKAVFENLKTLVDKIPSTSLVTLITICRFVSHSSSYAITVNNLMLQSRHAALSIAQRVLHNQASKLSYMRGLLSSTTFGRSLSSVFAFDFWKSDSPTYVSHAPTTTNTTQLYF